MTHLLELFEHFFIEFVQWCILLLELMGVLVLLGAAANAGLRFSKKDPHVRLKLAQGIALALEFKLGSEVLRTVIVREWSELAILGAVILMRGLLTGLIHWEIKNEQRALDGGTD